MSGNGSRSLLRDALAWGAGQRVMIALFALIAFGALRYDHFLGAFNVLSVLRYNSDVRADRPSGWAS